MLHSIRNISFYHLNAKTMLFHRSNRCVILNSYTILATICTSSLPLYLQLMILGDPEKAFHSAAAKSPSLEKKTGQMVGCVNISSFMVFTQPCCNNELYLLKINVTF